MPKKPRIGSRAWAGHIQLNSQAGELVDPSTWRQVDEDALSEERRELFLRRKKAVLDYFDGASAKEILQNFPRCLVGVSRRWQSHGHEAKQP